MGLPVLRLPFLALDNVYQFLDVPDKILLSQCSRRVKDLVRSQEGQWRGCQVAIRFGSKYTTVQVVPRIKDFTFLIYPVRNRELTDEKRCFNLNIDGTSLNIKECSIPKKGDWYCVSEEGCYEKDVLIIVKMLRNLLNCSIFLIHLMPTNFNFQKLFVETDALHRADGIYIHEHQFAPEDIDFMFEHFVTDLMWFRGYCGPEYSYQKPLNFPKVHLGHATWVNLEKVFEITKTSKHVDLKRATLIGDEDINQFIKWWLASDNMILKTLIIARGTWSSPQSSGVALRMNRSVIMEGIESTPGKKKQRNWSHIQWKDGVDIVRKDGVQATIVVNHLTPYDRESFDEFIFAAWHHPNPNVDN